MTQTVFEKMKTAISVLKLDCPIRFNGLPVSDERCGQFG